MCLKRPFFYHFDAFDNYLVAITMHGSEFIMIQTIKTYIFAYLKVSRLH